MGGGMLPRRLHPTVIDKAFKRLDVLCPLGTLRSPPLYLLITFPDSLRILWGNECASGGTARLKRNVNKRGWPWTFFEKKVLIKKSRTKHYWKCFRITKTHILKKNH
ncbi:hypothetical protein CDAR_94351 [Caerostris darwini]|uniref:Uncharacterized protein n=1 Tax=Caerostris darwini TaxID=1538125 RepID=A0AAV4VR97_9ARAC|nr:hypothetical protein CDAR_94351 [Caerostris darwini]